MTSQLNYLIIQHRHTELVCRAEHARLANEAPAARSASSSRWNIARLLASRRLRAARLATAAPLASPGTPHECLTCDT
jgi:hypothetical protein